MGVGITSSSESESWSEEDSDFLRRPLLVGRLGGGVSTSSVALARALVLTLRMVNPVNKYQVRIGLISVSRT